MYLQVSDLKKSYGDGSSYAQVLRGISTSVEKGNICLILGPSGSGKSTLLNCIGGLETSDSGSITVDGQEITKLKKEALAKYRRDNLGFIFQFYNLVPNLTVKESIQVCQYLSKDPLSADELMETLGLSEHAKKFPSQISVSSRKMLKKASCKIQYPR